MAIIKKKTRKAITKQVKKIVKKHGPEIAMGLVTNLVTGITAAALSDSGDEAKPKKKKRSNGDGDKSKAKTAKK